MSSIKMTNEINYQHGYSWMHSGKKGNTKIVLLHGYADSCQLFAKLIPKIENKYEVFALDLPMCEKENRIYSLNELADYVLSFTKKLKLTNYLLVGFSLGGMVATKVASLDEHNLSGLILLNSSPSLITNHKLRKFIKKLFPIWKQKVVLFIISRISTHKLFRKRLGQTNIGESSLMRMKKNYISVFGTLFSVIGSSVEYEFINLNLPKSINIFQDDAIVTHKKYYKYLKNLPCQLKILEEGGHASKPIYWENVARMLLT
jgi:pimeloyl-ACP methyl ester carboxylesterase